MDPESDPDADPDPAIFVIDPQGANKKLIKKIKLFCLLLFEVLVHVLYIIFKDEK